MNNENNFDEKEVKALEETSKEELNQAELDKNSLKEDLVDKEIKEDSKEKEEDKETKGEDKEAIEVSQIEEDKENEEDKEVIGVGPIEEDKEEKKKAAKKKGKDKKEKKEPKTIKLGKLSLTLSKKFLAITLATCLVVAGAGAGYYMYKKATDKPIDLNSEQRVKSSVQKDVLEKVRKQMKDMRDGNGYFNLVDGKDSSETYIYNSHGEAIAQGSKENYISVFRNDGNSVRFTDTIGTGKDIEILQLVENSLKLVESRDAVMTQPLKPISGGATDGMEVYYVSLTGWDEIKKLYTPVSEEFANNMIDTMKKAIPDGKEIKIRFKYIIGKNGEFSTGCELIMDGKEYTLWYFDGYLLLYDWQLPDEWYTADFSDTKKANEMLTKLLTDLDGMFKKYADDNNLPTKSDKSQADSASGQASKDSASGQASSTDANK